MPIRKIFFYVTLNALLQYIMKAENKKSTDFNSIHYKLLSCFSLQHFITSYKKKYTHLFNTRRFFQYSSFYECQLKSCILKGYQFRIATWVSQKNWLLGRLNNLSFVRFHFKTWVKMLLDIVTFKCYQVDQWRITAVRISWWVHTERV